MRLVAGSACALLLVLACHGGSGAPPDASQTGQDPPAEPPASVPPPPGETAQPPGVDLTCAERLYAFPVGPSVDGPVPCSGDVCVESAPAGMGHAFIAGERGSLWAIADAYSGASIPSFLRQEGDRWVAVCPPPGGRMVTAAYGARGDDVWIG